MDAEMRVMQPQAQEHQEPPEAERGREGYSHRICRGSMALPAPWFQTSGPQICERTNLWSFVMAAPEETIQHTDADGGEASLRACGVSFSGSLLIKHLLSSCHLPGCGLGLVAGDENLEAEAS